MLRRQRGDWEELAAVDPLWAILSDPSKEGGRWELDDFLVSGKQEIDELMRRAERLGHPFRRETALDFGCGVGRNTRALSAWFTDVIGLDVSAVMIKRARAVNRDVPGCSFRVNDAQDLADYATGTVDLLYSTLVLQHMLSDDLITGYVREFLRLLAPGGLLVFQLPTAIPWRYRLQPRRRLYRLLRAVGLPADLLQRRFRLYPISMRAISGPAINRLIAAGGGTLLAVDQSEIAGFRIPSATYWVTRP
jgi:SAM-dependent methyltransferase